MYEKGYAQLKGRAMSTIWLWSKDLRHLTPIYGNPDYRVSMYEFSQGVNLLMLYANLTLFWPPLFYKHVHSSATRPCFTGAPAWSDDVIY